MKRKKINRSLLFLMILGIFVTIVAMSVVYAALSSKLLIDGSAEVPNSSFGIKVEKASIEEIFGEDYQSFCSVNNYVCYDNVITSGNGSLDSVPVVTNTSISNFKYSVEIPGDMVGVFYKITNTGTIPVKFQDVIFGEFVYTSFNNSDADLEWANNNLDYDSWFERMSDGSNFSINDILCPNESVIYIIGLGISNDVTTIPSGGLEISNNGVTYEFLQTDQYLCES